MSGYHPNLDVLKFTVKYDDGTVYDVQVKGTDELNISIPEDTTFQLTIHFFVKEKTLRNLRYKSEVKAYGVVMRKREEHLGDELVPRDEPYTVTFGKDTTPKGRMLLGDFACLSTFYAEDRELFQAPWKLTVTKKLK